MTMQNVSLDTAIGTFVFDTPQTIGGTVIICKQCYFVARKMFALVILCCRMEGPWEEVKFQERNSLREIIANN